jgi:hypothetical protein
MCRNQKTKWKERGFEYQTQHYDSWSFARCWEDDTGDIRGRGSSKPSSVAAIILRPAKRQARPMSAWMPPTFVRVKSALATKTRKTATVFGWVTAQRRASEQAQRPLFQAVEQCASPSLCDWLERAPSAPVCIVFSSSVSFNPRVSIEMDSICNFPRIYVRIFR